MHGAESLRSWLSPCWSVNSLVLWNLKIHYFAFRVCHWTLSWVKWIFSTSSFQLVIAFPSPAVFHNWSFPSGFVIDIFILFWSLPCALCVPSISVSLISDCNNIWWNVLIMKLLIIQFSPSSFLLSVFVSFSVWDLNKLLSALFSHAVNLWFSFALRDQAEQL